MHSLAILLGMVTFTAASSIDAGPEYRVPPVEELREMRLGQMWSHLPSGEYHIKKDPKTREITAVEPRMNGKENNQLQDR